MTTAHSQEGTHTPAGITPPESPCLQTYPALPRSLLRRARLLLAASALLLLPTACSIAPKTIREHRWRTFNTTSQRQVANNLADAASAWDLLKVTAPDSDAYKAADKRYNTAVARVIGGWGSREMPRKWLDGRIFEVPAKATTPAPTSRSPSGGDKTRASATASAKNTPESQRFAMEFLPAAKSAVGEISPLSLDRVILADGVKIRHDCKPCVDEGFGVPVVGQVMRSEELAKKYPWLPLNGANLTLTAVIEFGPKPPPQSGQARTARLRFLNPLSSPQTAIGQRKATLAANYTASKELALNDGFLRRFSMLGLLMPGRTLDQSGLYLLDAYDPKRIPVVFVHGLVSDPHIWYNAINSIYSDPILRARYQPWYFLYPTGLGVPASAKRLRDSLVAARETLDANHNDNGMNHMVLVSHSMGGLLSRMQTIDSKDIFWKAYFTRPPEAFNLSPAARERLVAPLQFSRQPNITRLIFIATPHRGSSVADVSFIYHLSSLIKLPLDSLRLTKEVLTGNSEFLEPQIRSWGLHSFLSVGTLSPKHPFLKALNAQPIPVPHHSVIARIGRAPLEESSDGVVKYESSHLATGTEKVVRHWHSCVEKQDVVDEVVLRLKQHAKESGMR